MGTKTKKHVMDYLFAIFVFVLFILMIWLFMENHKRTSIEIESMKNYCESIGKQYIEGTHSAQTSLREGKNIDLYTESYSFSCNNEDVILSAEDFSKY